MIDCAIYSDWISPGEHSCFVDHGEPEQLPDSYEFTTAFMFQINIANSCIWIDSPSVEGAQSGVRYSIVMPSPHEFRTKLNERIHEPFIVRYRILDCGEV